MRARPGWRARASEQDGHTDFGQLTVVLWAAPKARVTFDSVVRQAGGRHIVDVGHRDQLIEAFFKAMPSIGLVDEDVCDPDSFALLMAAAVGRLKMIAPPVILMASEPARMIVEGALSGGFDLVIAKPFSARTLVAHVARAAGVGGRGDRFYLD